MGSSHDFEIAHRGQEPATTTFCCICNKRLHRWRGRFMGSEHLQNSDVNRSHEPVGIPLNRPSGTFSPIGGEGRDEGGGSWKAPFRFCACIGTMNHPLTRPSAALSPSDGEREGMRGRFMESPLSF